MDDIIIFHNDKEYLRNCLVKIENMLNNYFKLEINKKKTKIFSSKEGFIFLGYSFKVIDNKTIIKIKKETILRIKKRIKQLKYLYDNDYVSFQKVFCSLNTYLYSFKYADNIKVKRVVDKFF